ncbi:hypothetical protein [Guptibacillus hwajinpoensis]|uniref:Uncharacterized protein n=1 Tax=Guptibacillus hwajinpoensis TaxID=208199 RepID=A0ABU0K0C0_9BACL|nr:hypothetical protein [Alkalihalobacillus hemicentroti]MDQ0482766.1 hypothetical protein [Alkalihalobacillus hemicentroti]
MKVSGRGWKQVLIVLLMILCCVPVVGFSESLEEEITAKADPVLVNHRIKNKDLFVECVIPNFSFDQNNDKKDYHGYIDVFLDGKKQKSVKQAAFIVHNLPEGKHIIRLDIMRKDGGRYLSLEEFQVEIK